MKHLLMKALAGSGLLLFGLTANAQLRSRGEYAYQDRVQVDLHQTCDRIRADLDRAASRNLPFTAERARINTARDELNQFERGLDAGYVDGRNFDRMVAATHRVADVNAMSESNRDALSDDLNRLQDIWESSR
jgi:hypothetical protein